MATEITIPGTPDPYIACSYDELCTEAQSAIDGVVNLHALGARITEPVALAILRFIGMDAGEASDLLADARHEASKN